MAINENTIRTLLRLGLTEYEARIYTVLVKMGQRSATEISFLGKVPRPKTYGSIKNLESKGLLKVIPGKPERYMALSPNEVLFPLVEKLAKDVEDCNMVLENLALSYESSKYVHIDKPFETHDFWTFRGREKINKKLFEMIKEAKKGIYMTSTANGIIRIFKIHSEAFEEVRNKGVEVYVLTPLTQQNETAIKELKEILAIRTITVPISRFICVDTSQIMFIEAIPDDLSTEKGQDIASWTNDPLLIKVHRQLFTNIWQSKYSRPVMEKRKKLS